MGSAAQYWTFRRLTSGGQVRTIDQPHLKLFLEQHFAEELSEYPFPDIPLQKRLFDLTQDVTAKPEHKRLAEKCLRCRISYQVVYTCQALVKKYGKYYGFELIELLVLVLDDDLKPFKSTLEEGKYQLVAQQILEKYKPEQKSSLNTWVTCRVRDHSRINQFLLQRGLYRKSDWGILNDTSISRLERILIQDGLSTEEIEQACNLLSCYHRIYQSSGTKGTACLAPTNRQLEYMAVLLGKRLDGEEAIRAFQQRLEKLAKRLRRDWIEARGGKIREEGYDTLEDLEHAMDNAVIAYAKEDDKELEENTQTLGQAILTARDKSFPKALDQAVAQVLENRYQRFAQSTSKKKSECSENADKYWRALKLFFIENQSLLEIAKLVFNREDQPAVTKLLKLSETLRDVRRLTLHQMLTEIQKVLKTFNLQTTEDLEEARVQIDIWLAGLESDRQPTGNLPPPTGNLDCASTQVDAWMSGKIGDRQPTDNLPPLSEIAKDIDELTEKEKKRRMTGKEHKQSNQFTEAVCRYLETTGR